MGNHGIIDDLLAALPKEPVPVQSVLVGAHTGFPCAVLSAALPLPSPAANPTITRPLCETRGA